MIPTAPLRAVDVRSGDSLVAAARALVAFEVIRSSSSATVLGDLVRAGVLPVGRERETLRMLEQRGLIEEVAGDRHDPALRVCPKPPGWVLAVDVGGTKVRACLADSHGELVVETIQPTVHDASGGLAKQIAALYTDLRSQSGVTGIQAESACVGVPAAYDAALDRASKADNLLELHDIHPRAAFAEELGMPVVVAQDSQLAAVAEKWLGWAQQSDDYVIICIGTGISMGVVLNGEIYRGGRGAAGEIGDLPIGDEADLVARRLGGIFEDAIAGPGIARRYAGSNGTAPAAKPPTDAKVVFEAALAGDPTANRHIERACTLLARGIGAITAVLDPELVVLGGGVGGNPMLLRLVRHSVDRLVARPPRIETSGLVDTGPMRGAIAVALATKAAA